MATLFSSHGLGLGLVRRRADLDRQGEERAGVLGWVGRWVLGVDVDGEVHGDVHVRVHVAGGGGVDACTDCGAGWRRNGIVLGGGAGGLSTMLCSVLPHHLIPSHPISFHPNSLHCVILPPPIRRQNSRRRCGLDLHGARRAAALHAYVCMHGCRSRRVGCRRGGVLCRFGRRVPELGVRLFRVSPVSGDWAVCVGRYCVCGAVWMGGCGGMGRGGWMGMLGVYVLVAYSLRTRCCSECLWKYLGRSSLHTWCCSEC